MSEASGSEYLQYVQPETSVDRLSDLQRLAEQQAEADAEVKSLEAKLAAAKEKFRDLSERQVPELMDEIGMAEFTTRTGLKIKVEETIRAAIPKAKEVLAFAWLREHKHSAMIKRTVSVAFGKDEDDKAANLLTKLGEEGFEADDKAAVHPSTLSAFVREKLKAGEEVPLDLFGVHRQRVSKIQV